MAKFTLADGTEIEAFTAEEVEKLTESKVSGLKNKVSELLTETKAEREKRQQIEAEREAAELERMQKDNDLQGLLERERKKAEEFNIKQVGQNLIIVKGDEKLSRKFENKEERDKVKELAAKYSFKPSVKLYNEIKSLMSVAKEERKDYLKKAADKAKGKKDEKPVEAKLVTTEEQIKAAKKLLEDNNYNVTAKIAAPTKRYRGEH